jgi:hypothetical protein
MKNPLNGRRLAVLALTVAAVPFAASPASAATHSRFHHEKPTSTAAVASTSTSTSFAATQAPADAAPAVTSVIAIGGYVFYNLSYTDAVAAWQAAVAAAPAGYTPPPVYSVSVDTTVSGTVVDPNG